MPRPAILVVNTGSSSLKFALFAMARDGAPVAELSRGSFDRIDHAHADYGNLATQLRDRVSPVDDIELVAVAHRVVHGGARFNAPILLDDSTLAALDALRALSPEHLPAALSVIDALRKTYANVPHIACFDTAFHHDLPVEAARLPIPRRYDRLGVRRYGFHGISYAYLMQALERVAGRELAAGRIVLAHLGHGASLAAVRDGRCIDTTMALTPASGIPMSTRSGDLDPGLFSYLSQAAGMTAEQFQKMVHTESGLLGISEISGDVRDLLAKEADDPRAAEALSCFCYQVRKSVGALAAALGGIDALILSGGIGENAAILRARICEGLGFLGLVIDANRNERSAQIISDVRSRVPIYVLHTDEEQYIAGAACSVLARHTS